MGEAKNSFICLIKSGFQFFLTLTREYVERGADFYHGETGWRAARTRGRHSQTVRTARLQTGCHEVHAGFQRASGAALYRSQGQAVLRRIGILHVFGSCRPDGLGGEERGQGW